VLETPNPRNLVVGACNFYIDPTHVRPVHPDWLAFALEGWGLARVKLIFAQPDPRYRAEAPADPFQAAVNELLFGPQDYAAVGYRP
jgi:O-antigen chain-terminating methyltransferase